jgi:hypothetical protein
VFLRKLDALAIPRPELFKLRVFEAWSQFGTLQNGCPFEIHWIVPRGPGAHGEIRMLGPIESLGRDYAYLRLPPPPSAPWSPSFDGWRHAMSTPLFIGATSYLGLWHRSDGGGGSLVARYEANGAPVTRLGTTHWTYDGVYPYFAVHQFMFTLVDEPEGSDPLYIATFEWARPVERRRRSRRRR